MYISYIITHRICSRYKFNLRWNLKPIPLDLCSDACSTELASLTKERCSTVNVYTRSGVKKHKLVPECWELSWFEPLLM